MTCYARLHARCTTRVPRADDVRVCVSSCARRDEGGIHGCVAHAGTNKTENNNHRVRHRLVTSSYDPDESESKPFRLKACRELFAFIRHIFTIFISRRGEIRRPVSHSQLFARRSLNREKIVKRVRRTRREREREKSNRAADVKCGNGEGKYESASLVPAIAS